MSQNANEIINHFKPKKIIYPILIGLGVASFLLFRNFDKEAFAAIHWTTSTSFWIFMALVMVAVRDLAYMYRIKVLTDYTLSWMSCFNIIFLWEFASALAPPILGGGFAFAIFIINGEKIKMGKSISVVLFTSFLDGLFFALVAPFVYFIAGKENLFSGINISQQMMFGKELFVYFWFIYFVVLIYKLFVAYALFINARAIKWALIKLFSFPILRRWRQRARQTGDELMIASKELKNQNLSYWLKSIGATFASWTARFILINCLIMAFSETYSNHFILYGRQVVMGIINIGTPTPGGSGVAELMFTNFLGEFIPKGLSASLALLWRLISYYPYLFIGVIILPRWLKKMYGKTQSFVSN